jgi:hypothetical protein
MDVAHSLIRSGDNDPGELSPPIRLCGTLLHEHRHVCAFFNSREDEYRITLPFIHEGLARGEKAYHLIGADRQDDHVERLEAAGIDTAAFQRSGQFELHGWDETYFGGQGYFDPDRWLAVLEQALASGPPITRFVAHMEWALEDRPGVDRIVEYEAGANYMCAKYKNPVICCYDLARFSADVVIDTMRTHPLVIIGGTLQENPFFVHRDELINELRSRRGVGT